ncbi:MAG: hypothetical protein M1825_001730 [Sarcosagium campestre]|nr:MAG: hypothetical protein M1825_001730 [Sarcosagium campestre]
MKPPEDEAPTGEGLPSYLLQVPFEILIEILSHLPFQSVRSVRSTSRYYLHTIDLAYIRRWALRDIQRQIACATDDDIVAEATRLRLLLSPDSQIGCSACKKRHPWSYFDACEARKPVLIRQCQGLHVLPKPDGPVTMAHFSGNGNIVGSFKRLITSPGPETTLPKVKSLCISDMDNPEILVHLLPGETRTVVRRRMVIEIGMWGNLYGDKIICAIDDAAAQISLCTHVTVDSYLERWSRLIRGQMRYVCGNSFEIPLPGLNCNECLSTNSSRGATTVEGIIIGTKDAIHAVAQCIYVVHTVRGPVQRQAHYNKVIDGPRPIKRSHIEVLCGYLNGDQTYTASYMQRRLSSILDSIRKERGMTALVPILATQAEDGSSRLGEITASLPPMYF